jgi:hypothetical protein
MNRDARTLRRLADDAHGRFSSAHWLEMDAAARAANPVSDDADTLSVGISRSEIDSTLPTAKDGGR